MVEDRGIVSRGNSFLKCVHETLAPDASAIIANMLHCCSDIFKYRRASFEHYNF